MILSLKEVSYRRQGKNILQNISWEFKKGQTWAILGLNGAGKSTLLRILTAEFWKSSGELTVLGVPFGKGDIPTLRTKIGIVGFFPS
jgi:iron complex transport system ATP-binding protein